MTTYVVSAAASISASPQRTYGIIADYREGHPRILPKAFTSLLVEKGGIGAGTIIRVQMQLFGRRLEFRGIVTEPSPGHVLVERNAGEGVPESVTTFTVEPGSTAADCVVTISSEFTARPGLVGAIERVLSRRVLQRLYRDELKLLDAVARGEE